MRGEVKNGGIKRAKREFQCIKCGWTKTEGEVLVLELRVMA